MIFTFGFGHTCKCGRSLRSCFTELPDRARMVECWGVKWAFEYCTEHDAGVERHGLHRVVTDEQNADCRCGETGREPFQPRSEP